VVIEDFSTSGANPSLGECVCPWRLEGKWNDLHALGLEDLVEAAGELGVPIMEKEARRHSVLNLPG